MVGRWDSSHEIGQSWLMDSDHSFALIYLHMPHCRKGLRHRAVDTDR